MKEEEERMRGWADVVVVDEEKGRTNLEEEDNKGDIGGEIKIEFSDTGVDVGFFSENSRSFGGFRGVGTEFVT